MDLTFCSLCSATAIICIIIAFKILWSKKNEKKSFPHGVVILHQIRGGFGVPSPSPPCMKLETYLRMAKFPYECDTTLKMSSKGKMPWIEYNGQEIADSNFCIEFLKKEYGPGFGVDVDNHLSDEQKGIARALLVMIEENTYWTFVYDRWCGERQNQFRDLILGNVPLPFRAVLFWLIPFKRKVKGYLYGHGIGRHSVEEIYGIGEKDLKAVSAILGNKKFLFGDRPCLTDATLFALVSNVIYTAPQSPQGKLISTQLRNLEEHMIRMKETFYPDWDEVASGKKKTA